MLAPVRSSMVAWVPEAPEPVSVRHLPDSVIDVGRAHPATHCLGRDVEVGRVNQSCGEAGADGLTGVRAVPSLVS